MSANGAAAQNMAAAQGGGSPPGFAGGLPNFVLPNSSPTPAAQTATAQAPQLNLQGVQSNAPALQNNFTPQSIGAQQQMSPQAMAMLSQAFNSNAGAAGGNPLGAFSQAVGGLGQYMPTTMPTLSALPSNAATQLTSGWQGQFTPPPVQSNVMSQAPVAPPPAAAAAPPPVAVATNGWPVGMTPIPGWTYAQYQAALNSGNQQAQQVALYSEANQSPSGGGNNGGN